MTGERDHYQVLGVDPSATTDEVRAAHRRLLLVMHPDRHVGATRAEKSLAERRMREINDAWNVLKDPIARRSYDAQRATTARASQKSTKGTQARPRTAPSASRPAAGRQGGTAGRGAYWTPSSAHAHGSGTSADEGIAVRPMTAQLLRKGPIIVIAAVVLGLFVVTAYAGGRGGEDPVQPTPIEGCARVYDGSDAIIVPCDTPNDGRIVAQVEAALDCPERAPRYVKVGTAFFCIEAPAGG